MLEKLPELHNRLVILGNQVVFGMMPFSQALQLAANDAELQSLPDEALEALVHQARAYWREDLELAIRRPQNVYVYPALIKECVRDRLQAIGRFRAGQKEARHDFDVRFDHWITLETRCLLDCGLCLLLIPESKAAWETFTEAAVHARALPDLDRPRLREMLFAAYGQGTAAFLGQQPALADQARQEVNFLLQKGGAAAAQHLEEIEAEFAVFAGIYQRRSEAQQQPAPAAEYLKVLNELSGRVKSGQLELAAARGMILERARRIDPGSTGIYYVSGFNQNLAHTDPDSAVINAELDLAAAAYLTDELAAETRANCQFVLGFARARQARVHKNDPDLYRQAAPHLEAALAFFQTLENPEYRPKISVSLNYLAMCYRGMGDFHTAAATNRQAIALWESLGNDPVNLGMAYGNLGDNLEQLGEFNAAFDYHDRAFRMFLQAGDISRSQQALFFLNRLAGTVGRIDDAVAALEKSVALTGQSADALKAIESMLAMVSHLLLIGKARPALELLQRVEDLLAPWIKAPQPEREALALHVEEQVWKATIWMMLLNDAPDGPFSLKETHEILENARILAYELMDERLFARTLLQLMTLHYHVNQPDMVAHYNGMLDLIRLTPTESARREENLGMARLAQGDYPAAVEHLKNAQAAYPAELIVRQVVVWNGLGRAYEAMDRADLALDAYRQAIEAYEASRTGLYEESRIEFLSNAAEIFARLIWLLTRPEHNDPVAALVWLDRSKSRTFVETMGLARLALPDLPEGSQALLAEEARLLEKLNALRLQLFVSPAAQTDQLELQKALRAAAAELDSVWDRIERLHPEYVALRRGASLDWPVIQGLVAAG